MNSNRSKLEWTMCPCNDPDCLYILTKDAVVVAGHIISLDDCMAAVTQCLEKGALNEDEAAEAVRKFPDSDEVPASSVGVMPALALAPYAVLVVTICYN